MITYFLFLCMVTLVSIPAKALEPMQVTHMRTQMIGMRVAYLGCTAEQLAPYIAFDIGASGHFSVDVVEYRSIPAKKQEITALSAHNILFLLILEAQGNELAYRLYDTTTGEMVPKANGCCTVHRTTVHACAHHIADKIWQHLMGIPSPFLTHIAYAKEVPYKKGITVKHLCVADYDGNRETVVVASPTISIAPRWGGTRAHPLIFYSEYTNTNVRLMAVDMHKKCKVVTRCDGTSMHLTPNHDGSMHAFSSSRGNGISQIYIIKNGELLTITENDGTNGCPTFNHDGTLLYYCSNADTDIPHIMGYDCITRTHAPLPVKGLCEAPAYNGIRKLLAYSKLIDRYLQIFVYDTQTSQERQITFDAGNHEDPTWSPCGNFVAYTHELKGASRIRMQAYTTGHTTYITPAHVNCTYPAWSRY